MTHTIKMIFSALLIAAASIMSEPAHARANERSIKQSISGTGHVEGFQSQAAQVSLGAFGPLAVDIKTIVPGIESLWLADADNDTLIDEISDGEIFYAETLPANLTVIAQANDDTESVAFGFDDVISFRIENIVPYALAGDDSGDYAPADLSYGWHTVRARPYAADGATGSSGNEVLISFGIVENRIEVDSALDGHDSDPGDGQCLSAIDDLTSLASQGDSGTGGRFLTTTESLSAAPADAAGQQAFRRQGACTLRAAIEEANARAGIQHIVVPFHNYHLPLGQLEVTDNVTVEGIGLTPIINAQHNSRIFEITAQGAGQTVFENLMLRRGYVDTAELGGAVYIHAQNFKVTFTDVWIEDSIAGFRGGGIYAKAGSSGILNVFNSRIEGNYGSHQLEACEDGGGQSGGGGIYAENATVNVIQSWIRDNCGSNGAGIRINKGAHHLILRSTVSENRGPNTGAGVFMENTDARIEDSTISHNEITGGLGYPEDTGGVEPKFKAGAGGIHVAGSELAILSATIVENDNPWDHNGGAGGIKVFDSSVTMRNTVLANNNEYASRECFGPIASEGGNFIGETNDDCDIAVQPSDILDEGDPELGIFQNNGGLTSTMMPSETSRLIDNGVSGCGDIDQRGLGFPAPLGDACDIGSVER